MTAVARIKPRRSGLLAEWQPVYAEHGIALFPVKAQEKKPAISNWIKVGLEGSAELARKFAASDAFGFAVGRRSGITVLDVDTPDERVLMDAMARHGESPFIVRTHSGKWPLITAAIARSAAVKRATIVRRSSYSRPR